jgi:hypothetical protein
MIDVTRGGAADPADLYEQDFVRWTEEQARAIREGRLDALDREHLAEEIESMGRSDRREVRSRLAVIIQHILKQRVQPALDGPSWRSTIDTQRDEIAWLLRESPSLRGYLDEAFATAYPLAIKYAVRDTSLPADMFQGERITLADALGDVLNQPLRRRGGRVREESPEWLP